MSINFGIVSAFTTSEKINLKKTTTDFIFFLFHVKFKNSYPSLDQELALFCISYDF